MEVFRERYYSTLLNENKESSVSVTTTTILCQTWPSICIVPFASLVPFFDRKTIVLLFVAVC